TRFSRDWSSDVCSSDLLAARGTRMTETEVPDGRHDPLGHAECGLGRPALDEDEDLLAAVAVHPVLRSNRSLDRCRRLAEGAVARSEERRGGQGCRARGA